MTHSRFRIRDQSFSNSRGFTYLALLAAIVIIGISLGSAARSWQNISMREKEEELVFRGNQYRLAIERYYVALPARRQYPATLEDLLKDTRTPTGRRHLRQKYKDPITGDDFVLIQDQLSKRIIGVRSSSERKPLKQGDFPDEFRDFEGKTRYNEWLFVMMRPGGVGQTGVGQTPVQGHRPVQVPGLK